MIILDCETTGLLKPVMAPLDQQPYIIELCAIKLNNIHMRPTAVFDQLFKPPTTIPEEITKITGLKNSDLVGKPSFTKMLPRLIDFFLGEPSIMAHNAAFDLGCLEVELRRVGKVTAFPWPPQQLCSVELSMSIKGHRLNLNSLHQLATGKPHEEGAHRAKADVEALIRCIPFLKKEKLL